MIALGVCFPFVFVAIASLKIQSASKAVTNISLVNLPPKAVKGKINCSGQLLNKLVILEWTQILIYRFLFLGFRTQSRHKDITDPGDECPILVCRRPVVSCTTGVQGKMDDSVLTDFHNPAELQRAEAGTCQEVKHIGGVNYSSN